MAAKKSTNKKTGRTVKKTQDKRRQNADINRISGVLLFALSLLFLFIAIIKGQGAWLFIHNL